MEADKSAGGDSSKRWVRYRVVLYLVLGLLALDVVVRVHSKVWRAYDPKFYPERLDTCRKQSWDMVVVGGSPVMCGIDTDVLAGTRWQGHSLDRVYNLGLPLGTTAEVCLAVEHGLPSPPRLLVYGITITDLNDNRFEPQGPCYLMNIRDAARFSWIRPRSAWRCSREYCQEHFSRLWQLFYCRNGIRLWIADEVNARWPGVFAYTAAQARAGLDHSRALHSNPGLVARAPVPPELRLDHLKAIGANPCSLPFLEDYRLGGGYLTYLHRLLDWAARHEVEVLLVNMPVPADLERLYPQAFAAYAAALEEVERSRGVSILRPTREAVGLTDADFSDLIHLNGTGAARLSAWLRRTLADS